MRKLLLAILFILFIQNTCCCEEAVTAPKSDNAPATTEAPTFYTAAHQARRVSVFSEGNLFGLKDKEGNIVAPAEYQKIIMTGRSGWIVQRKDKYGLMDSDGNYLVEPKYRYGDRILGRYTKLGNDNDFGIYNEYGEAILTPEYSSIELLYGQMFLTYKNFRYGVADFKGEVLIPNICDDIYMPTKDTMKIKYMGEWYVLNDINPNAVAMPDIGSGVETNGAGFNIKDIVADTGNLSGYSVLTFSDYMIKIVSSISPAHEETIDDLILSHGVDTVGILKKFSWIPKYPFTFTKKYIARLRNPYSGPLADTRNRLKNKR